MRKNIFVFILLFGFVAGAFGQSSQAKIVVKAEGYDSHVELTWTCPNEEALRKGSERFHYHVFMSSDGGKTYVRRGKGIYGNSYLDFPTDVGRNVSVQYRVCAHVDKGEVALSDPVKGVIKDFSDDELLDMVQRYTFRFFWDYGDPETGMIRERISDPKGDILATGATGFGFMAMMVGAERGYVPREQAVERLLKIINFLETTERFHGMWSHWYDGNTLKGFSFSHYDDGADIVESSFLAQGFLAARQYFNKDNPKEKKLREKITALWETMEWNFFTQGGKNILYWHWSPNYGWKKNHGIAGYNECLITYIMAGCSPTHPIRPEVYHEGWAMHFDENEFTRYNEEYKMFHPLGREENLGGPLFFAHYSYLGMDPRGLSDRYADYWEQNRRHTLINRAYCIKNPRGHKGYGEDLWGLTSSDNVRGSYSGHAPGRRDSGNIPPTAALSSMPYTPQESMKVLKNLYRNHGQMVFGPFGFYDAIHMGGSWFHKEKQVRESYIGIDQGPIIIMIENYRSGLVWNYFMKDKDVLSGLNRLGFKIDEAKRKQL